MGQDFRRKKINYMFCQLCMFVNIKALRLQVKETLYIREHEAYKSLNGNLGFLNLLLW